MSNGLTGVPLAINPLSRKDFVSDQDVRWCPGCGDYAILSAFQQLMPNLGIRKENTVIISGIGCSSRFPYYVDSFGMHTIHGRALTLATGLAMTRSDLAVFVITGDGDALSIGGNHLIHALRRNVNLTVVLFNNEIYGLTKGQFSPTSALGKVTKTSPMGTVEPPVNASALALGAGATFAARVLASDRKRMSQVLEKAAKHRGASLVEVYQNCPIFNDGAFEDVNSDGLIWLEDGQPAVTADGKLGVVAGPDGIGLADASGADVISHNPHIANPSRAFELSQLSSAERPDVSVAGILREVEAPTFDDLSRAQVDIGCPRPWGENPLQPAPALTDDQLAEAIAGPDTWVID